MFYFAFTMKLIISTLLSLSLIAIQAQYNCTQFVDPKIGTGGHGHTFPGATLPFAMVQLSPDTRIDGSWDGCSGYHHSDSIIYGFSHTHLSGTGCSDYGDIAFMPTLEIDSLKPIWKLDTLSTSFTHRNEIANAGYYSVLLNNEIHVELTSTKRVGMQRYTYKKAGLAWITLNLKHRDELLEGKIKQLSRNSFSGFRRSKAWAEDQLVNFYFEVSRDATIIKITHEANGETKINLGYVVQAGDNIIVKTAISSADEAGAKNNMNAELPNWDFEATKVKADQAWNLELNRIKAFGGTTAEKINFYTALYHCMIHPNIMNDVDGRYRGRDKQIHTADGFNYFTVFSLWDTYRALHPLLNIIDKERSRDFVLTFLAQFEQSGRLPMWELWGNETNCMIGFHSVSVILDAFNNHAIGSEALNAIYTAVKTEAMSTRFGLSQFRRNGFLSIEDESESVSKTLEYSYDMYCVSQIAYATHHNEDALYFSALAAAWKNVYDTKTGFMRPRKNGGWLTPFDPKQVNNHYTEANGWQYSFAVPQNYEKIYDINKLSELFNADSKTTGREQSDISGLIGQYAQGNEPSHHIPYLFNNIDSTGKYVKQICNTLYKPTPDGLCGNEDCGQMSAWYVFSAMGFYPVNPSTRTMVFGNMVFDSVTFSNGESVATIYKNKIPSHYFKPSNTFSLWDLQHEYYFGFDFPTETEEIPYSVSNMLAAPVIASASEVFNDSMSITISANEIPSNAKNNQKNEMASQIYYTLDGAVPSKSSLKYDSNQIITITSNTTLNAICINDSGFKSAIAKSMFFKRPNHYTIKIKSVYNKQYTADGDEGLIDGLHGDTDWRKGRWQGYQSQNFEAVIDLNENKSITQITSGFLQDTRSWILYPTEVAYSGSIDGINFEPIGNVKNTISAQDLNSQRKDFSLQNINKSYRFVKVMAINFGILPSWHQGVGGDAFIFVDEITVE